MMYHKFFFACLFTVLVISVEAQNVGIGTTTPERILEVEGFTSQYARVHTPTVISESGIEFTYGNNYFVSPDWSIVNDGGTLKLFYSQNNFQSREEVLRVNSLGELGIGTNIPSAPLHIDGGQDASNTQDGYMMLGSKLAQNIVIDNNEILSRYDGAASTLYLQNDGGNIHLQSNGGTTYMAGGDSEVGVNTTVYDGKFNVKDNSFQMFLRNTENADNDWYIGASTDNWAVGGDQLIFSPSASTSASILRLMDVGDNDGISAPVVIKAGPQKLLIDGNEVDCATGALYINHNSNQNTLINTQGGSVGIGTTSPNGTLHVKTGNSNPPISIQITGSQTWKITPFTATYNLGFIRDNTLLSTVDDVSGQWTALSDGNFKENITPLYDVLDKLDAMNILTYSFKHDKSQRRCIGVMAQAMQSIFPEVVVENDDRFLMSYGRLSVIALKALQEQQDQIARLQSRLEALLIEKRISAENK